MHGQAFKVHFNDSDIESHCSHNQLGRNRAIEHFITTLLSNTMVTGVQLCITVYGACTPLRRLVMKMLYSYSAQCQSLFIDRYIRREDVEILALLVSKVQKHRHSARISILSFSCRLFLTLILVQAKMSLSWCQRSKLMFMYVFSNRILEPRSLHVIHLRSRQLYWHSLC